MEIQILKNKFALKSEIFNTFFNNLSVLIKCKIVDELVYNENSYFIIHDHYDLDDFDKKILSKTILLNMPSPSVKERLSKYKVLGLVETRLYFKNYPFMYGLEGVIDFNRYKKTIFTYKQDPDYVPFLKKERTENYRLANLIVDYLKMHQDYTKNN